MIYFIVTTSLINNNCNIRETQYINGINKLKQVVQDLNIENYKIIIVENNGIRNTFLNMLDCDVYYTSNNFLQTNNKGYKELQDVLDCIEKYNINDSDFIVKMTGRYILNNNSEFMNIIKNIHNTNYDCVIKYCSVVNPSNYKMYDIITGLIGMSCFYVKQIEKPNENDCVEWKWDEVVTNNINNKKIYIVKNLDINICPFPNSNQYYMV